MRQLSVFRTFDEAAAALDNGGRFWNVRSKQDDGAVTAAEFGVAGGDFGATRDALLRMSLQCSGLLYKERLALFQMFDSKVQKLYKERGPRWVQPSSFQTTATAFEAIVVSGYCRRIGAKVVHTATAIDMAEPSIITAKAFGALEDVKVPPSTSAIRTTLLELALSEAESGEGPLVPLLSPVRDAKVPSGKVYVAGFVKTQDEESWVHPHWWVHSVQNESATSLGTPLSRQ